MTQLHKKLFLVLIAVTIIAALLLPAPRVANHLADLDAATQPAVQETAGLDRPFSWWDTGDVTISGYTWAG
jgi:hypothetical protein